MKPDTFFAILVIVIFMLAGALVVVTKRYHAAIESCADEELVVDVELIG